MKKKSVIGLLILLCLSLLLVACGTNEGQESSTETSTEESGEETSTEEVNSEEESEESSVEESEASSSEEAEGKYTPGTYEQEIEGYNANIKLAVTFTEDKIESIEILEHEETPGIGTNALEIIPQQIVDYQSLKVDKISGATVTSSVVLSAVSKAVEEAGGDVEALKNAEIDLNAEPLITETDILVVGGGGAGLSAAVAASEDGHDVILIEKTAVLGGNTARAGGPYNIPNPEKQQQQPAATETSMAKVKSLTEQEAQNQRHQEIMDQLAKELEDYNNNPENDYLFDSNALHILQTYDGGDYVADLQLVEKMVTEGLDTLHWLMDNGVVFEEEVVTATGALWQRSHKPIHASGNDYIVANEQAALDNGVTFYFNSKAEELIIEDGRVVGVRGTSNGEEMEIRAKAVILATGGFGSNQEMINHYNPEIPATVMTTNAPAIQGEGMVMAEEVGAQLIDMEQIQLHPLGDPQTGDLYGVVRSPAVESYYLVNNEGKRFVAEDERRDVMSSAEFSQPDGEVYLITSSNSGAINEEGKTYSDNDVEKLIKQGKAFKGDTIEDLAEQIGVDPQALAQTHEEFNECVRSGQDPEFGRTSFGDELSEGPFYASPRTPSIHHTMGGVKIDTENHVIDTNGEIIPGLYAAGEVTGGIHGSNRLGGNALTDIHVFGRSAGRNAVKDLIDLE